jgi:hypothetical protein
LKKTICLYVAFAAGLTACSKPAPNNAVSPKEALDNIHAWNGKDVIVEGWLGTCKGFDCNIYDTLADARIAAQGSHKSTKWQTAIDRGLGIGDALNFDELAAPLQFQKVQISGRLSDNCRRSSALCKDRSSDIQPKNIMLTKFFKKEN